VRIAGKIPFSKVRIAGSLRYIKLAHYRKYPCFGALTILNIELNDIQT